MERCRQVDSTATGVRVTAQKEFLAPRSLILRLPVFSEICNASYTYVISTQGEIHIVNLIYRENSSRYPDILFWIREERIHFLLKTPQSDQQSTFVIKPWIRTKIARSKKDTLIFRRIPCQTKEVYRCCASFEWHTVDFGAPQGAPEVATELDDVFVCWGDTLSRYLSRIVEGLRVKWLLAVRERKK